MKKTIFVVLVLVLCVGLDQITKEIATQYLSGSQAISYFNDVFRLQYSENTGAFLSLGAGLTDDIKFWVFTVSAAILLLGVLAYILLSSRLSKATLAGMSMIVGGGIGNLIDRVVNDGAAVDFMNIGVGNLRTGIFNFADVAITVGLAILILFYRDISDEPVYNSK